MASDEAWAGRAAIRAALVIGLATLTLGLGLGRASRLTYHEAIVAQTARELIESGFTAVLVPTIAGRPWLEKPPLPTWLAGASAVWTGRLDEAAARLPSAAAAALLALGVATLAARRYGQRVGLLAGLIQATTAWTVARGRLAEADVQLACLVTWAFVAFDAIRAPGGSPGATRAWRWAFFGLLGLTSLVKGVGFGAALMAAAVGVLLLWDRDGATALRLLRARRGWACALTLALAWPALVVVRHPEALGLWTLHLTDRLAERPVHFAGDPWWSYAPAVLGQTLPWTPLALVGAWGSLRAAVGRGGRLGPDRLLWAWAVAPMALLSMATIKNGHYAIHALPPWSVWAALGLIAVGERLRARRGWTDRRLRLGAAAGFGSLGLALGLGAWAFGPWLDQRGPEWAFYETVGRTLGPSEPLALLYDDWDRNPYPTPFGPVPHDLAVRLFYLGRSTDAPWRRGVEALADRPPAPPGVPFAVIARPKEAPDLRRLGRVELIAESPPVRRGLTIRADRLYAAYRITPGPANADADATAARPAPGPTLLR